MKSKFHNTGYVSSFICMASNGSDMGGGGPVNGAGSSTAATNAQESAGELEVLRAEKEKIQEQRNALSGQLAEMRTRMREADERAQRSHGLFVQAQERMEDMRQQAESLRRERSAAIEAGIVAAAERDELKNQVAEMGRVTLQEVKHRQELSRAAAQAVRLMETAAAELNDTLLPLLKPLGGADSVFGKAISDVIDRLVLGFTRLEDAQSAAEEIEQADDVADDQPRIDPKIDWSRYDYLSSLAREGLSLFGERGENATQRLHTIYGTQSEEYVDRVVNAFWESIAFLEIYTSVKNSEHLTEETVSLLNDGSKHDSYMRGFVLQTIRTAQLMGEGKSIHSIEVTLGNGLTCPQWKLNGGILMCSATATQGQIIDAMAGEVMIEVKRIALCGEMANLLYRLLRASPTSTIRPGSNEKNTENAYRLMNQLYRYRAVMDAGSARKLELHFTSPKKVPGNVARALYRFFGKNRVKVYRYSKELAKTRRVLPDGSEEIVEDPPAKS